MNNDCISSHSIKFVSMQSIAPHDQYDHFSELLAATNYLLPSAHAVQKSILTYCLLMHPILVIKARGSKDRYVCVGGIRSYSLAQSHYSYEDNLPVILLERPDIDIIKQMINADVLVAPMLYSLRSPKSVGSAYQSLTEEEIVKLFKPKKGSKTALAKTMRIALNTIFPSPDKRSKGA